MSQHPSLRSKRKGIAHRTVLKRYERLKELKEKEKWDEEKSIFGLPKLKILKFKIKKEKPVEAEAAAGAEGVAAEAAAGAKGAQVTEAAEKPKKEAAKKEAKGKGQKK
ncbi:MAG: small basic protein [Candidatus Omnitrophica bacterium]|nr:small basic protein [Candidatus Omnitrophota bacterium]